MTVVSHDRVQVGVSLRLLATIEVRRQLRSIVLWVAALLTVVINVGTTSDWSGGSYEEKVLGFMPLVLAALIAGYRTGRRDQPEVLADGAPLGPSTRSVAHLAGIAVPVAMSAIIAIGLAIVSRLEGGFWIGEAPRRTDTALHSLLELLQPPLFVALAGAFGVAAARVGGRRSVALVIVGGLVWFLSFPGYWVWNIPPVHTVALVQVQPFDIDLATTIDPETLPKHWLVDPPGEHNESWRRKLVHQPTVAGHDLYLVGLIAVAAGAAIRSRTGRRLAVGGGAVALAGVIIQLAVMPTGLL